MEVTLIDKMGNDIRVTNAARVSFKKFVDKELPDERDEKLIKYLAEHNHFTPFTHCMITLHEKIPIFICRQRFKHQIGFTYNEVSRRYVDDEPEYYEIQEWRKRAENKKQGSSDELIKTLLNGDNISKEVKKLNKRITKLYTRMIVAGVAPEQARTILPQSMYTEYYVTGSLYAFARAYNLRIDAHAQKEIQDLAVEWDKVISPLFPVSWNLLTKLG